MYTRGVIGMSIDFHIAAMKQRCIDYYSNVDYEIELKNDETCERLIEHQSDIVTDEIDSERSRVLPQPFGRTPQAKFIK